MKAHRTFLTAVVTVCVAGLPCASAQDVEKPAITHGPYLQAVTESSATVVWFTNKNCVSTVEYAPEGAPFDGNDAKTARASHHGLIDANAKVQRIPLTDLKSGHRYEYRVVSKEIVKFDPYQVTYGDTVTAGPYRMQTWDPQKREFSFCVVNWIRASSALRGRFHSSMLEAITKPAGRWQGI